MYVLDSVMIREAFFHSGYQSNERLISSHVLKISEVTSDTHP